MQKRTKTREQLLAEATAVLNESSTESIDSPSQTSESQLSPALEVFEADKPSFWREHPSVKELEQKLSLVRWLRSQNEVRMRDTIEYTRTLERRDVKDSMLELSRKVREKSVEEKEKLQPLKVDASKQAKLERFEKQARAQERQRKEAIEKELRRVQERDVMRRVNHERNARYREFRKQFRQIDSPTSPPFS